MSERNNVSEKVHLSADVLKQRYYKKYWYINTEKSVTVPSFQPNQMHSSQIH